MHAAEERKITTRSEDTSCLLLLLIKAIESKNLLFKNYILKIYLFLSMMHVFRSRCCSEEVFLIQEGISTVKFEYALCSVQKMLFRA